MSIPASGGPPESSRSGASARRLDLLTLATPLAAGFAAVPGVVAVAVAGSRVAGTADGRSDLDLYVYADHEIPRDLRETVAGPDATDGEFDMRFWEPGDAWTDRPTGLPVDVTYRSPAWLEAELDRVLVRHEASIGYSTAIWHNVRVSVPLVDPTGWFARTRARADRPYPEPLRRAVVAKNHPILRVSTFSFLRQIEDAIRRRDIVAVQHRLTALLASCFDILFAINHRTHPGEKRLVVQALTTCPLLPPGFERGVEAVVAAVAPPWVDGRLVGGVHHLVDGLDELLRDEGLL